MAAAIKKEILEDEERQQRRRSEEIDQRQECSNHATTPSGHEDMDMDCVVNRIVNGHENGLTTTVVDKEHEEESEEDLRRQELRTHLFLATVSSHHHHHQQQQQPLHDPQDLSTINENSSSFHVPCPLCQVPLEQRVFRQHLDRHYPRDSPVCPVIQCGRRFAHPNSVRNHMRLKHAVQWLKMKAMRSSGGPFVGLSGGTTTTTSPSDHATPIAASNHFTKQEFL